MSDLPTSPVCVPPAEESGLDNVLPAKEARTAFLNLLHRRYGISICSLVVHRGMIKSLI